LSENQDAALREALLRVIVRASADGSLLDVQDEDIIVRHLMGSISQEDFERLMVTKAQYLQAQATMPQ